MATDGQRSYKQVARAQGQRRTRDALLDAASEELAKEEWSRASLEDLAAKAGVTKQTALRHFGSKEGLIEACTRRLSEIVRMERARSPIGDVPGAVHSLMEHYECWGDITLRMLAEGNSFLLVRKATKRGREVHHEWVARTFAPQLRGLSVEARERRLAQLVAICDVYVWKIMRRDMKLSLSQTETALIELIEALADGE